MTGFKSTVMQVLATAAATQACSNFLMDNPYVVSVRTMDLGKGLDFGVGTMPVGSKLMHNELEASRGFVGFVAKEVGIVLSHFVSAGMNDAGLTCDQQTLIHTVYPNKTGSSSDIGVDYLCEYILGTCSSVADVNGVLSNGTLTPHGPSIAGGDHMVVRDRNWDSVVIEFIDGKTILTEDKNNDHSGFGIMTNEPTIDWHIENVKHAKWKLNNARPAFSIPGNFYPDERFLRIYLLKTAMDEPTSYREAIMQAVHVLNSVTVPMGNQLGTDSSAGEGANDHTQFGVIYDHINNTMYWRTQTNQNLQRLRLTDAHLSAGSKSAYLQFGNNKLPWYSDAGSFIFPSS